jgi:solute carrier family 8 (sodium/calcium exchanger)
MLISGTKVCERLSDIILNTRLLKDIEKLSPLHQTSSIESFHSLILRFAPKMLVFSYRGMLCRYVLQLIGNVCLVAKC